MKELQIPDEEVILTTSECYKYLSVINSYAEIDSSLVSMIVENRKYTDDSRIPKKAIQEMNGEVCLNMIFSALADSPLFELGELKSILKPAHNYWECIRFIAENGDKISIAPTVLGRKNEALYQYMCRLDTGIKEIIPKIKLLKIPEKKETKDLYEYLFGIRGNTLDWTKYFGQDCFGIYRKLYPIRGIVIANMFVDYKQTAEYLSDYNSQTALYVERMVGGKLMIEKPFDKGHTPISELSNDKTIKFETGYSSNFSPNRIVFGAPGTGKSYTLNQQKNELMVNGGEYERVTFHPDYSYANFVGTYKPVPLRDENGNETISYEYVPGPFMRILVKALNNGCTDDVKPFLLIIEEINRANVAAVFGDVFQLLDRNENNVSEYPIEATEDMKKYLAKELKRPEEEFCKIRIPDNMFLWATMNSADQGVYPMDTAFKRRWDFTYIGINDNDEDLDGITVALGRNPAQIVEWNKLRKAINNYLAKAKINEDKQLGPYFIARKIIVPDDGNEIDSKQFIEIFKSKVIMYLFEDAAKQRRASLFEGCFENSSRYSDICREFDEKGIGIFNHDIQIDAEPTDMK